MHGTAANLSQFEGGSFDAVLVMGPLYHLTRVEDRQSALAEAARVLKPGGKMCCSFITVFAPIRDLAKHDPE
ncbi:MAG: methyltransferase domain-containing protein [Bacillota bacterium]